jgi:hypothetical protein
MATRASPKQLHGRYRGDDHDPSILGLRVRLVEPTQGGNKRPDPGTADILPDFLHERDMPRVVILGKLTYVRSMQPEPEGKRQRNQRKSHSVVNSENTGWDPTSTSQGEAEGSAVQFRKGRATQGSPNQARQAGQGRAMLHPTTGGFRLRLRGGDKTVGQASSSRRPLDQLLKTKLWPRMVG